MVTGEKKDSHTGRESTRLSRGAWARGLCNGASSFPRMGLYHARVLMWQLRRTMVALGVASRPLSPRPVLEFLSGCVPSLPQSPHSQVPPPKVF